MGRRRPERDDDRDALAPGYVDSGRSDDAGRAGPHSDGYADRASVADAERSDRFGAGGDADPDPRRDGDDRSDRNAGFAGVTADCHPVARSHRHADADGDSASDHPFDANARGSRARGSRAHGDASTHAESGINVDPAPDDRPVDAATDGSSGDHDDVAGDQYA